MRDFYMSMRTGVLDLSLEKKSFILFGSDIKNLEQYKNAPKEFQEDFDGNVLGALSKGSIKKGQTLQKTLKSPFANITNFAGETSVVENTSSNIVPFDDTEEILDYKSKHSDDKSEEIYISEGNSPKVVSEKESIDIDTLVA